MNNNKTMQALARNILKIKAKEEAAKIERQALENELAALIATKDEGPEKAEAGRYRISVTSKLTRTLDYETYLTLEAQIPETLRPVRMKPEIDLKVLRAMDMAKPGFSAQFITTKPAKHYVKIEEAQK